MQNLGGRGGEERGVLWRHKQAISFLHEMHIFHQLVKVSPSKVKSRKFPVIQYSLSIIEDNKLTVLHCENNHMYVEFVHKGGEGTNMHTATMQSYCEGGDAIVCVGRPIMWRKPRMPLKESQLQLGLWDLSLPPPPTSFPLLPSPSLVTSFSISAAHRTKEGCGIS